MSDLRLEIGRDLSRVVEMFASLSTEAVNRAGDPDIPGGAAMVMLGPGRDIEAFGYAEMSELMGRTIGNVWLPDRGDIEPPLSFLASWADIVREARGQQPSARRAKILVEVNYLRSAIDWMLASNDEGEPWFIQVEDFADGLAKVRTAMESVLHDGDRPERIRARCNSTTCLERPRLTRVYGFAPDGSQDHFRCHKCGLSGGRDWVAQCWHRMVAEKGDPDEWVTVAIAAAATGRSPKTIHRWTELRANGTAKVEKRTRTDGRIEVRWIEVRVAHDLAAHKPWQKAAQTA